MSVPRPSQTPRLQEVSTMLQEVGGLQQEDKYPVPRDPFAGQPDDRRLWLGNLDTRITEFTLLKLLQKHGSLEKFDFLYHKAGPDRGKPRGYCFVTYSTQEEAEKARLSLHGKLALGKRLVIKYAHAEPQEVAVVVNKPIEKEVESQINPTEISTETKIRAIEAKLQLMEQTSHSGAAILHVPASLGAVAPWTDPKNHNAATTSNTRHSVENSARHKHKPYQRGSNYKKHRR